MKKIEKYFITGLLTILPIFLTIYLFYLVFKWIDSIIGGFINGYLESAFGFSVPGLGFFMVVLIVLSVGFIVSHILSRRSLPVIEGWFLKLPMVRRVYAPIKQIVSFVFSQDTLGYRRVVLVQYPSPGIWSVGFMTNEGFKEAQQLAGEELVHVLIGSTPGPWSGFLILVPKKDVKFMEMTLEESMKLIISGGILKPS